MFLVIGLGVLISLLSAGYLLKSQLGKPRQQTFVVVDDYLRAPETVPERVAVISQELRRIQIGHSGVEAYDLEGQRYSISPDGTHLEGQGGAAVPERSFRLDEVDFTQLPAILAAATQQSGAEPSQATLEYVGEELRWRVSVRSGGETRELIYTLAGEPRPR